MEDSCSEESSDGEEMFEDEKKSVAVEEEVCRCLTNSHPMLLKGKGDGVGGLHIIANRIDTFDFGVGICETERRVYFECKY